MKIRSLANPFATKYNEYLRRRPRAPRSLILGAHGMTTIVTRDNEHSGSAQPTLGGLEPGAKNLARRVPRGVQGWQHPCAYLTSAPGQV